MRLVGPPTLMPALVEQWGCEVAHDLREGIAGADVVMMLRLQLERMDGAMVPFGARVTSAISAWTGRKLAAASPQVRVMHPRPDETAGVEIDSEVADDPAVSLIQDQVEMGVAARMGGAGVPWRRGWRPAHDRAAPDRLRQRPPAGPRQRL